MANVFYPKGKRAWAEGRILWRASGGDTFRAWLIDTASYTYSASHEFLSSVPESARVAYGALSTYDPADGGVLDAADVEIPSVTGPTCEAIVICKWTGDPDTSPLLIYIDEGTGLPVTPNGGSIAIVWSNDSGKIAIL